MMSSQQMNSSGVSSGGDSFNAMSSIMGAYKTAKDKWDASGGNEALSRVTASIPDSTKNIVAGLFKREHIRSIGVYFGIGEERPFYVEKTPSLLIERLRHNLTFFYLNYAMLTALLFCLTLLISPSALIGMGILAALWMYVIRSTQNGSLQISSVQIPQQTVIIVMGGVSVFVLFYLLSGIFWWTLFSSGFLILLHAFLRDASMHKDMDDAVKMEGDLHFTSSSNEDTAFLSGRV